MSTKNISIAVSGKKGTRKVKVEEANALAKPGSNESHAVVSVAYFKKADISIISTPAKARGEIL